MFVNVSKFVEVQVIGEPHTRLINSSTVEWVARVPARRATDYLLCSVGPHIDEAEHPMVVVIRTAGAILACQDFDYRQEFDVQSPLDRRALA